MQFTTGKADVATIHEIAARAWAMPDIGRRYGTKLDLIMDVSAVHANGNPLRLRDLLAADDFNFLHDIWGIRRHINRDTGKLDDRFSPRFSVPEPAAAAT